MKHGKQLMALAMIGLWAGLVSAGDSQRYVTGFYADTLYGYAEDDPYEEVAVIENPQKSVPWTEVDSAEGGKLRAYYEVIEEDDVQGLWLVRAGEARFWVEKVAVIVKTTAGQADRTKIPCDELTAVSGRKQTSEISGAIGLGERVECEPEAVAE